MKTLLLSITILLGSVNAQTQTRKFPNDLEISLWENRFYKSTPENIRDLVYGEFYSLPQNTVWPERLQKLVLEVYKKYYTRENYKKLPPEGECAGDDQVYIMRVIEWQKNPLFLPALMEDFTTGLGVTDALVAIGEPAFQPVIDKLNQGGQSYVQQYIQWRAIKTIEVMFEQDLLFLQRRENQALIRQGLINVAEQKDHFGNITAVIALQHVSNAPVITLLNSIKIDPGYKNTVREEASRSLERIAALPLNHQ